MRICWICGYYCCCYLCLIGFWVGNKEILLDFGEILLFLLDFVVYVDYDLGKMFFVYVGCDPCGMSGQPHVTLDQKSLPCRLCKGYQGEARFG